MRRDFICVCNSQGVHVDHCWVDTYNGEFMSPCFDEGRCRCNNITADCSSNNGSLTYVPRLPVEAQVFNFSNNNLSHIPDGFFSNVSQNNRLFDFPQTCDVVTDEPFFPNLKYLVLDQNMISSIKDPVCLPELLQEIDLGGNPFYCSCDIRWFQEWMSLHPHQFGNYDQDGYMCDNILNTPVQFFQINDQL
ncbi:hypothetical protein C0Q70_01776 [Pomacea canaliculata]|uniref:LRRCT domain-containing protein n=1 Tax=Pomacea canaliculata TaxID=400727 RepID=A0A2T7Q0F9_POMCA|nr:hypothetical protein C0Q70_01776 [Pomacea canaliculata]